MNLSIGEISEVVERASGLVENNGLLRAKLGSVDPNSGRLVLDSFMLSHLKELGLSREQYQLWEIREWVAYKVQEKTGIDLNFCGNFRPSYRERVEMILGGNFGETPRHRCENEYHGIIEVNCNGANEYFCGLLAAERQLRSGYGVRICESVLDTEGCIGFIEAEGA